MTSAVGCGVTLAELAADPHAVYARLRASGPTVWLPERRQWLVTRWTDVSRTLSDVDSFTSDIPNSPMSILCGGVSMLSRRGADHHDLREAMIHDYDPHRVSDQVDTVVRPTAERIADFILPTGSADLVSEYFEPVAMISHTTLLGLEVTNAARLRQWGMAIVNAINTGNAVPDALGDMDNAIRPVVTRLREHPDDSIVAHLIHTNHSGDGRPDEDVLPTLKLWAKGQILAGWLGGWTMLALLDHPAQLEEVRQNRWLLGAAVYEALRWNGPVGIALRRTTRALTLSGKPIPADAVLAACMASANRDETMFPNAESFDIHRTARTHLGFGGGSHHCPAFALVPAIVRTALDVLLDRMPDLRPALGWSATPSGWPLRHPGPIPALWSPR